MGNNLREECVLKGTYSFVVSFERAFNCIPICLANLPNLRGRDLHECLGGPSDEDNAGFE